MAQLRKSSVSPMKMQTFIIIVKKKKGKSVLWSLKSPLHERAKSKAKRGGCRYFYRVWEIHCFGCCGLKTCDYVSGPIMCRVAGFHFGATELNIHSGAQKQRHVIRVVSLSAYFFLAKNSLWKHLNNPTQV